MQQRARLLTVLLLAGGAAGTGSACPPGLTGESIHWRVAVCMQRYGTDDFLHPGVQRCFDELEKADGPSGTSCALNLAYKTALCKRMIGIRGGRSLQDCIQAADTIPKVVSEGGI